MSQKKKKKGIKITELFIEVDKMARRTAVKLSESNTTSFPCRVGRDSSFCNQAPDKCSADFGATL